MSIQYALVVYMVGLPTHINLTSLSRANHFYRSVRIKEHAFPRSLPLAFTITVITSLPKKIPPPPPSYFAMRWEIFYAFIT